MSRATITTLLKRRHFAPYFYAQALGALNDNVLKNSLAVLIALKSSQLWGLNQDQLINLSAALFIMPFFLVSAIAGQLADKYEKARQIRWVKGFELFIMMLAAVGWWQDSLPILLSALCLMGLQSALFSPIKYALLPQALPREQLMAGNGLSEAGSFVAILLGTGLGPSLMGLESNPTWWVAGSCLVIAVIGYLISFWIPRFPATAPDLKLNWNPFSEGWNMLKIASKDRAIFLSILALSWFWYFGATYLVQIPSFTINVLGVSPLATGVMMGLFIVGISVGSLACHRLTAGRIETGLVAIGGIGMTCFGVDFFFSTPAQPLGDGLAVGEFIALPASWRIFVDMVMMGICGGFFAVPLYALIQDRSPPHQRARIMAANSMLNALYMVVSAFIAMILLGLDLGIRQILLITALANVIMLVALLFWMPGMIASFVHQLLSRTRYRRLRADIRTLQAQLAQQRHAQNDTNTAPADTDSSVSESEAPPTIPPTLVIQGGSGTALMVAMVELGMDRIYSPCPAPSSRLQHLLPMVFTASHEADQASCIEAEHLQRPEAQQHLPQRHIIWLCEQHPGELSPQLHARLWSHWEANEHAKPAAIQTTAESQQILAPRYRLSASGLRYQS